MKALNILTIILIALKLTGLITLSWVFVLLPSVISIVVLMVVIIVLVVFYVLLGGKPK